MPKNPSQPMHIYAVHGYVYVAVACSTNIFTVFFPLYESRPQADRAGLIWKWVQMGNPTGGRVCVGNIAN
jgi:hypothetical protein